MGIIYILNFRKIIHMKVGTAMASYVYVKNPNGTTYEDTFKGNRIGSNIHGLFPRAASQLAMLAWILGGCRFIQQFCWLS